MLSHLLRITTLAKGAVAVSLVAGAYGTAAANSDLPGSSYDAYKMNPNVERPTEPTAKPEPKRTSETKRTDETKKSEETKNATEPKKTDESEALAKACLAYYLRAKSLKEKDASADDREAAGRSAREACERAIAASGLTAEQFRAKYGALIDEHRPVTKPEPKTGEESKKNAELYPLVKECAARYAKATSLKDKDASAEDREASGRSAREACERAIEASGLTPDQFWAKFRALLEQQKPAEKPNTTKPEKPTTKPEKPATTKPSAELEQLVKECARLYSAATALKDATTETREAAGRKASEACKAAISASGLTPDQFWAKYRPLFEHKTTTSTKPSQGKEKE